MLFLLNLYLRAANDAQLEPVNQTDYRLLFGASLLVSFASCYSLTGFALILSLYRGAFLSSAFCQHGPCFLRPR
jgi:hypothetical protein